MWPPDAKELAAWWARFNWLKRSYLNGAISRIEAGDGLRNLRYRSDALHYELRDWEREREKTKSAELAKYKRDWKLRAKAKRDETSSQP